MSTTQLEVKNFYTYLPSVYDAVGLSQYAALRTPEFLEFIQMNGWLGRNVLEFGCGTGASAEFFVKLGFSVHGVDISPAMLDFARKRFENMEVHAEFEKADIRTFRPIQSTYDLVFALDVLNHVNTTRDLEGVFRRANYALVDGRMFLFDLHTIYGLSQMVERAQTQVLAKNADVFLVVENNFDYDISALAQDYTLILRSDNGFNRYAEHHVLRGYPLRTIHSLMERSGFAIRHIVDTKTLQPIGESPTISRILIAAEKVQNFA